MEKKYITEPVEELRRVQRVIAMNRFWSSGNKTNSIEQVCEGKEQHDSIKLVEVLLFFGICGTERIESQDYAYLQKMQVIHPIVMVNEIQGCVCRM